MRLYNTLTRRLEEFKPIKTGEVGIYSCGPTVYDHPHIGNLRTYINTDIIRRTMEYLGYKVLQVENITDVGHLTGDRDMGEDKIETAARERQESAWDIARRYEKEFFEAMAVLNIVKPTTICRATEHIPEMIALIGKIEKNGFAYRVSDGIYFDTSKMADYDRLSGMSLKKLQEGARVEPNPEKKNPTDFALWKFSPQTGPRRQMEWNSPWGVGFPGWHIECSAMGIKYLGDHFDIHTGGIDHIPVHHTNEIAQNFAATDHKVVNCWLHNEFLLVDDRRMGKSLKNFYTLGDIEARGFDPIELRYLFLSGHYRRMMNFTWESLKAAQTAYEKLRTMVDEWREAKKNFMVTDTDGTASVAIQKLSQSAEVFRQKFITALNDDFNAPAALAVLWETVKSDLSAEEKLAVVLDFDKVLGLGLGFGKGSPAERDPASREKTPEKIRELMETREKLRKERRWEEADKVREEIEKLGWKVEDTANGVKIKQNFL